MYRFGHKVAAAGCWGCVTMVAVMPGCGSGLGPVQATQNGGTIDHPNLPDVLVEKAKDCVSEYGKQLEPGRHRFDSTVEVDEERVKWDVTIDGVPDTAPDLGACLRIALQDMPIAEEPFRQGVETLKYRRQEALAEQRKLVGHPVVIVIAGATIVVGEVMLEAGAYTILFAVSVELIDKASKDVAELAKRGFKKCVTHYTACMATSLSNIGNHWKASVCNTCFDVCGRTGAWPANIGLGSCHYWEQGWGR